MSKKGKSLEIARSIRDDIRSGKIAAGGRFDSIPKLAVEHGTTVSTISKVLGILEAEGLVERINGLGVFVKSEAKRRFALVFDSAAEEGVFSHKPIFMRHFIEHCRANALEYTVFENVDTQEDCLRLQKEFQRKPFDLILAASRHFAKHSRKYLRNIPAPVIGLYPYKWLDCCISFKDEIVSRAAQLLKSMGCEKIGVIVKPDDSGEWCSQEIVSSIDEYKMLMDKDKKTFGRKLLKCAAISPRSGYEMAQELLEENADAGKLGIISTDSIFTHGILSAVLQSRNTLWEEIFVASHVNSDSPMTNFSIPVITYMCDIKREVDLFFALSEKYFRSGAMPTGNHLLPLECQKAV